MEIIGAGFGRCGTSSTFQALTDLNYKCYHMSECVRLDHVRLWINYFDGDIQPLLDELEKQGFQGTLDFPIIAIFDELLKRNPNAKVLLNVRDNPKQWIKSFRGTIWKVMTTSSLQNILFYCGPPLSMNTAKFCHELHDKMFKHMIEKANSASDQKTKTDLWALTDAELEVFYNNWIQYVKKTVPKEKLLIFNVKDGIEPMAKFCGQPVPDWPMPHANDTKQFGQMLFMGKVFATIAWVGIALFAMAWLNVLFNFGLNGNFLMYIGFFLLCVPLVCSKWIHYKLNEAEGKTQFFKIK